MESTVNACCQVAENLKEIARRENADDGTAMVTRQCQVCERKHYELIVPTIPLAIDPNGVRA